MIFLLRLTLDPTLYTPTFRLSYRWFCHFGERKINLINYSFPTRINFITYNPYNPKSYIVGTLTTKNR